MADPEMQDGDLEAIPIPEVKIGDIIMFWTVFLSTIISQLVLIIAIGSLLIIRFPEIFKNKAYLTTWLIMDATLINILTYGLTLSIARLLVYYHTQWIIHVVFVTVAFQLGTLTLWGLISISATTGLMSHLRLFEAEDASHVLKVLTTQFVSCAVNLFVEYDQEKKKLVTHWSSVKGYIFVAISIFALLALIFKSNYKPILRNPIRRRERWAAAFLRCLDFPL